MALLHLKPGREKSLLRLHPWVFSGAVARLDGRAEPGETVPVVAADGRRLATAAWSPQSQLRARVWSFDAAQPIDEDFFAQRIRAALAVRPWARDWPADGCGRLVNAESDGLPGLTVDRYGDYLSCQFQSAGVDHWKPTIVALLEQLLPAAGIYDRSDRDARSKEGLITEPGVLSGSEPPELIEVVEHGLRLLVDVRHGHKTGMYLDQRANRRRIAEYAPDRDMLNCFAYTGGFSVAALAAGARSVVNVEGSAAALELGRRNLELNDLDPGRVEDLDADVFNQLRSFRDARRDFDLIVLDPPKFADSRSHVERAARGYKDINLLAFKLLRPGGVLFTFSCSGQIGRDLFQKIVADAAVDARRGVQILEWLSQAADHPVALGFPEGAYLKGLVCRAA